MRERLDMPKRRGRRENRKTRVGWKDRMRDQVSEKYLSKQEYVKLCKD